MRAHWPRSTPQTPTGAALLKLKPKRPGFVAMPVSALGFFFLAAASVWTRVSAGALGAFSAAGLAGLPGLASLSAAGLTRFSAAGLAGLPGDALAFGSTGPESTSSGAASSS